MDMETKIHLEMCMSTFLFKIPEVKTQSDKILIK